MCITKDLSTLNAPQYVEHNVKTSYTRQIFPVATAQLSKPVIEKNFRGRDWLPESDDGSIGGDNSPGGPRGSGGDTI